MKKINNKPRINNCNSGQKEKITIKLADSETEIRKFQKFSFQIYEELQWLNRNDFPDGILADKYDAESAFIIIYSDSEIIGGMRLVKSSEMGFPHEKELGIDLLNLGEAVDADIRKKIYKLNKNRIVETTRFVGQRTGKRILTIDLAKGWYWYSFYNDIKACFMAVDLKVFLLMEKLFIPLRPVGIPKYCEGSWVIPCVLIVEDMMSSLKEKNTEAWKYIMDKSNLHGDWRS